MTCVYTTERGATRTVSLDKPGVALLLPLIRRDSLMPVEQTPRTPPLAQSPHAQDQTFTAPHAEN